MSKTQTKANKESENTQDSITQIYNEVYKGCRVGMAGIKAVKGQVSDQALVDLFNTQYKSYETLSKEVELQAAIKDKKLESPSVVSKAVLLGGMVLNSIKGNNVSNIAEGVLQGINGGMINLIRLQNAQKGNADNEMIGKLMGQYQNNMEVLKSFL